MVHPFIVCSGVGVHHEELPAHVIPPLAPRVLHALREDTVRGCTHRAPELVAQRGEYEVVAVSTAFVLTSAPVLVVDERRAPDHHAAAPNVFGPLARVREGDE